VLVERASVKSDREVAGKTENNRWVNFQAEPDVIGRFVKVVVTEALPNSLRGRLQLESEAA
jgi:tRNA-2-methylthio-N6-dimethylallyladenosine synthase